LPVHLGVVVCVRDRQRNTALLAEGLAAAFKGSVDVRYTMWVVEQADTRPFNRGALLNAGFILAEAAGIDVFALQDVDFVPLPSSAHLYLTPLYDGPRHLLGRVDSAGGAVLFTREQFRLANGYPNGFWGWGFEDHDLLNRLECAGLSFDRQHWRGAPDCDFTCFHGFSQLSDCSGTHGDRMGCGNVTAQQREDKRLCQRANKIRFLAAREAHSTPSAAGEEDLTLSREHACGVNSLDFSVVGLPSPCGPSCLRIKVKLGDHEWGEVL